MTTARIMAVAVLIVGSGAAQHAARAQLAGTKRTDLQRHDLSVPGREVIQARVELDPGVASPRHTHPGEEIVYVLEGSLEYQVDGKAPVTLEAGAVLFIPAGAIHAAKNVGSRPGAELATYVVERGCRRERFRSVVIGAVAPSVREGLQPCARTSRSKHLSRLRAARSHS